MSALDKFQSLDETLRTIKEQHASEMTQMESRLKSAEIELELTKKALKTANERTMISERLAVKLITQFGAVESIFSEAKKLALQVDSMVEMQKETEKDPSPFAPQLGESQAIRRLAEVGR